MKTSLFVVVSMLTLSLAAAGCSRSDEPRPLAAPRLPPPREADAVEALLSAHEDAHADAALWARVPGARAALRRLVGQADGDVTRRARAAEALGFLAGAEELALLEQTAGEVRNPRLVRMGALTGLTVAEPGAAPPRLERFLTDAEPGVRARAIDLLGSLHTAEADALLAQVMASAAEPERLRARRLMGR